MSTIPRRQRQGLGRLLTRCLQQAAHEAGQQVGTHSGARGGAGSSALLGQQAFVRAGSWGGCVCGQQLTGPSCIFPSTESDIQPVPLLSLFVCGPST